MHALIFILSNICAVVVAPVLTMPLVSSVPGEEKAGAERQGEPTAAAQTNVQIYCPVRICSSPHAGL